MQVIHSEDDRRAAAIAKLAEVSKHLQASAAAVTNRLVRLAGNDYASPQKAIASLAVYQNSGLLCADDVQEAEALLRGEPITDTAKRRREREEAAARNAAHRDMRSELLRDGLIRVPGDTIKAETLCRLIIDDLEDMTEAELNRLYDDLCESRKARKGKRSKQYRTINHGAPAEKRARKAPASPFRVIEGGAD